MKSAAVVALALLESANAFQAPALKAARSVSKVSMFSEGDIGVLPPLGVYDPLGLIDTRDMFRYGARAISADGAPGPRAARYAAPDARRPRGPLPSLLRAQRSWRSSTAARPCSASSTSS